MPDNASKDTMRSPAHWCWLCGPAGLMISFLIVVLILLTAQLRVLTYITGQDPFTYMRLAQALLDSGFSRETVAQVAAFIAPGFPALLAVLIQFAGPFAAAWLNTVLLALVFLLLTYLLHRWQFPAWAPLIASLVAIWLVFDNHSLNPHFLLYAFRGAIQYFFIVLAYSVMATATPIQAGGFVRLAAASLLILIGALFRETTLLAGPAILLWLWINPAWRSARWRGTLWLAAPVLLVLAAGLGLSSILGLAPNQQAITWLQSLSGEAAYRYWINIQHYVQILLRVGSNPIGLVLGFIGLWHFRSRLHIVVLWLVPAIGWILFYAVFLVHRRYLLDSLFFLAILSGVGACHLLAGLVRCRFLRHPWWAIPSVAVLLIALNVHTIAHTGMWGPRVSRADLADLLTKVDAHTPASGWVLGEPYCVHLTEALWIYGHIPSPKRWEEWTSTTPAPASLLILLDPAPETDDIGISGKDAARARADVTPITDAAGRPLQVRLDELRYTLFTITPWTATHTLEPVQPTGSCGRLLWLDFQSSVTDADRKAILRNATGAITQTWRIGTGNGLIPLWLAGDYEADSTLEVISSAPLPMTLLTEPDTTDGPCLFQLGPQRIPSPLRWIGAPGHTGPAATKWGSTLITGATFTIPYPRGMVSGIYRWSLMLEPRFGQAQEISFHFNRDGQPLASFTNRLDRGTITHEIDFVPPFNTDATTVELVVDVPRDWDNHFRLIAIGGYVVEQE